MILRSTLPSMGHTTTTQLIFWYILCLCGQYFSLFLFLCTLHQLCSISHLGLTLAMDWFWIWGLSLLWSMLYFMCCWIRKLGLWLLSSVFFVGLALAFLLNDLASLWLGRLAPVLLFIYFLNSITMLWLIVENIWEMMGYISLVVFFFFFNIVWMFWLLSGEVL